MCLLNYINEPIAIIISAVLVSAAGVLAGAIAYNRNRKHSQIGLAKALKAEIGINLLHAEDSLQDWLPRILALLRKNQIPFITISSDGITILRNAHRELCLLESEVIEAVIKFQELDRFLSISMNRIGTDEFKALSLDRKEAFAKSVNNFISEYLASGHDAIKVLDNYIQKLGKKSYSSQVRHPE